MILLNSNHAQPFGSSGGVCRGWRKQLGSGLLLVLLASQAGADWKTSVDGVLDSARQYGEKALSTSRQYRESWLSPVPAELTDAEVEAQKQAQFREIWGKTLQRLDETQALDARLEKAPESRWFGADRKSLLQDRREVFDTLAALLNDPVIVEQRERILRLEEEIAKRQQEIGRLKEQRVIAVAGKKAALDADIAEVERDIAEYRQAIDVEKRNLQKRFQAHGLLLNQAQLTALLSRVDADDLIGMTVTFDVLADITTQLMQLMQESGEDIHQARKYYGMYVAMLEFVLYMQDRYIDKLDNQYLPRIKEVIADTRRVQRDSRNILASEPQAARKRIVRKNLEAQQLTLKVASLYTRQLEQQKARVQRARSVVRRDYRVAKNTYDTVKIGADLVRLMQVSQASFTALMNLQIPEIVPFENLEMQRKYEELSRMIRE